MAYTAPMSLPRDPERLRGFLLDEFKKISTASRRVTAFEVLLSPSAVEPPKPVKGLIAYADGTNWNPGSGEGVYRYDGSSWNYLG